MDKPKKGDPKKTLVRNTARSVPKTAVVAEEKAKSKTKERPVPKSRPADLRPRFQSPELNSALGIARKIDLVENATSRKAKSASNLAVDEKATRKVNFPYDQPIYKDLIPLEVPAKSQPVLVSREPLPQKDREPQLADFVKPRQATEFIYQPTVKMENQPSFSNLNNLKLYKILQIHE